MSGYLKEGWNDPNSKNYEADFDPTYDYQEEWLGILYEPDIEEKMLKGMNNVPEYKKVFATYENYLYYNAYYKLMDRCDEIRRREILNNINQNIKDPLQFRSKYKASKYGTNVTITGAILGTASFAGVYYILRFLKK